LGELDGDPDTMSVRALRRLPSIGPARAAAIARERWERGITGGPEAWDAIRGIGPETVGSIRRALDARIATRSATPSVRGQSRDFSPAPTHPAPSSALPPPRAGLPRPLETTEIDRFVRPALDEDRGGGDLTSFTAVPEKARARATLIAKGSGVLAGLPVFAR